jgi:Dolichyl-phosphate-mannose-protein mannosyltransferase
MGTDRSVGGSFWCERNVAYCVLLLCASVVTILHFWFMSSNSATVDELVHVESGYRYWQCGDYGVSPENPPLAKLVAAFPVRHWKLGGFAGPCGSQVTPSRGPDYGVAIRWLMSPSGPVLLWKARAAMVLFALALLGITFFSARSFFGYRVATVAAILLAFEPTLIAHGSLATIDIAFATCMLAAIWAAYEFAIKPTPARVLFLGLAMGLALASKFLALSIPLVALVVILLPLLNGGFAWRELLSRCGGWIAACVVAWAVIWAAYGFRYTALPHPTKPSYDFTQIFASVGQADSFWPKISWFLANHHLLPEAYIAGFATMKTFEASPAYFFGNVYPEGVWYYYPVALPIKLTIPVLVLALVAVTNRPLWRTHRLAMLTLIISALACLATVMAGRVNMGVRHALPIYTVLVLLAAAGCVALLSQSRVVAAIGIALVAFHVLSSLHSAPQQLSYANELAGGPTHLYRYLDDSNLDWGQSDAAIGNYVRLHPGNCAIGWFGPHRSNPPCLSLPTLPEDLFGGQGIRPLLPETFSGSIILQPTAVFWTDAYLPFLRLKPDETFANGSVLVYRGTFDLHTLAAVRRMNRGMWMMFFAHDPEHAAVELAAAEGGVPPINRPAYENLYGTVLMQLHRPAEAKQHFQRVLELTKDHPGFRADRADAMKALNNM